MKKFQLSILYLFMGSFLILHSCKDDDESVDPAELDVEALSDEEVSFFDEQTSVSVELDEIVLPNGRSVSDFINEHEPSFLDILDGNGNRVSQSNKELGPQDTKNLLISKIQIMAYYLTTDFFHTYPDEGSNKPAQTGLAYAYGSKDYSVRQKGSGECGMELYGLDCSGFIYNIFKISGVNLPNGTADNQRQISTLEKAIKDLQGFDKITVEDFGQLPINEFETGDIIYWTNEKNKAKHIGIVLSDITGNKMIYQSNGTAERSGNCENNNTNKRGPRAIALENYNWFGTEYGIVRLVTDISGEWTGFIRCANQTTDAIEIDFTIPANDGGQFTAFGNGIDYDGSPIDVELEGTYNKQTNILSGLFTFSFPNNSGGTRKDSFEVDLNEDETDYFNLTRVVENGGCAVAMKLVNKESNTNNGEGSNIISVVKNSNICIGNMK